MFLKWTHRKRLDTWSRHRCIGFCVTLLTRHVRAYENRPIFLAPNGTMAVEDFLEFRMCKACHAREGDLEQVVLESNREGSDRIYVERDENGVITRLGMNHGHSDDAFAQIDIDQLMTKVELDDPNLPEDGIMLHGT